MPARGPLAKADERRALDVVEARMRRESVRRYRCDTCGVTFPADELRPETNDDGKRVGWACENCY